MKTVRIILLTLLLTVVVKTKAGQMRSVCILIPAYDPEDLAEGENEEEEVRGWGPGPSRSHSMGMAPAPSHRATVITHHEEDGDGGGGGGGQHIAPPSPGSSNAGGSMTDPSKPPGPNPKWGYWEWDAESRRWEMEDFRRKRKKRQLPGSVLNGRIQCGPGTVIHVDRVMLGFSIDNRCLPVRPGCQATSTVGRQVSHCEGRSGVCQVSILQKLLQQPCGRRTNYAKVVYECIPESERHNICEAKSFQSTGSLVIASPSFSLSVNGSESAAQAQFLSCECEVNRGASQAVSMPWLRTRMNQGEDGVCGDELLLLDTWDDGSNRFELQDEVCGQRSERDKTWTSSVLKLTYIPSSPSPDTGFLLRVQGKPDPKAPLQVTCSVVPADGAPPGSGGPPPSPGALASAKQPPRLPANFDFNKYPAGLLNRTLDAWRRRQREKQQQQQQQQQQEGSVASQIGTGDWNRGDPKAQLPPGSQPGQQEKFDVKGMSGLLSAVVASLSSIIVIMGSLGGYLLYRRRQKKKRKQEMIYYDSGSTVRSDAPIYSEPTYQDPDDPISGIPSFPPLPMPPAFAATTKTLPSTTLTVKTASETQKTSKTPAPNTAGVVPNAPALPVRPPRRAKKDKVVDNKERVRRLPSDDEEDVTYDNNAGVTGDVVDGDVIILHDRDADYASLDEISQALASQDEGRGDDVRRGSDVNSDA